MNIQCPPQVGFSTSIDIVHNQNQKHQYSVKTLAGVKRPYAGAASALSELPGNVGDFKRPYRGPSQSTRRLKASKITRITFFNDTATTAIYTQRKIANSTPGATQNPFLSLSHPRYGLPKALVDNLLSMGIKSIYPWQSSCLLGRGLLTGEKNLVYTAPTGGGKSLVADVLMLKRVLEDKKKAILVLPYVALVQEKLRWLRRAVDGLQKDTGSSVPAPDSLPRRRKDYGHKSVRVVGFFGGSKARDTWADVDIAVCTIEKV